MSSRIIEDYEILIRFDKNIFTGYCPQLNMMVKNPSKEIVLKRLEAAISEYIRTLPLSEDEKELEQLISSEKQKAKENLLKSIKNESIAEQDDISQDKDFSGFEDGTEKHSEKEKEKLSDIEISTEELDGLFFDIDRAI